MWPPRGCMGAAGEKNVYVFGTEINADVSKKMQIEKMIK